MSTRTSHNSEASLFYITFTCYQWLPLFEPSSGYDLVYKWFDFLKEKYKIKTTAYTPDSYRDQIMFIALLVPFFSGLFFPTDQFDLSKVVGNGKRFIAYEIITRLKALNDNKVLMQLQEGLSAKQIEKGQHHRVFEKSFDAKPVYHRGFLLQKLQYIHQNRVRGKWKLVEHWEDYNHSSARFYVKNKTNGFVLVNYDELS